jgi:hypothetical protein
MWPRPGSASLPQRTPSLSEVVTTLATLGKLDLPAQLAQWLDRLDETGCWATLKLVTGALRIEISARLAKTAVAVEGHVRLLAPLAFLSPRIIAAIVDGTAPMDLTITGLAKALPYSWGEQEQSIGLCL